MRRWAPGAVIGWMGAAVASAASSAQALSDYAGGAVAGPAAALPLTLLAEPRSGARILDVALLVVVAAGLVAVGYAIRRSRPGFRPWVMASVVLGILFLTVIDIEPFQIERVELTDDGVIEHRHNQAPTTLPWVGVQEISFKNGRLWPMFQDDGALILRGNEGVEVRIPVEGADRASVAAAIQARLPAGVGLTR